jgi:DNA-binding protein HU-beta
MTKAELISKMAKDAKITKVAAGTVLVQKARQKARKGRNPQTGAPIKIKARNVVKFKAGKGLKAAI